jgi:hypothetical protein
MWSRLAPRIRFGRLHGSISYLASPSHALPRSAPEAGAGFFGPQPHRVAGSRHLDVGLGLYWYAEERADEPYARSSAAPTTGSPTTSQRKRCNAPYTPTYGPLRWQRLRARTVTLTHRRLNNTVSMTRARVRRVSDVLLAQSARLLVGYSRAVCRSNTNSQNRGNGGYLVTDVRRPGLRSWLGTPRKLLSSLATCSFKGGVRPS